MKRITLALMMLFVMLAVTGCGGGGHRDNDSRQEITTDILSDETVDGHIREFFSGGLQVVQGPSIVLAGVDPLTGDEYRGFLDFPLTTVPLNADIVEASLDIVIRSYVSPASTIPIRIDLVDFDPPLVASDFDRALLLPLASTTVIPPISSTEVNQHVVIPVTSLMVEAQRRGLPSFQIRILEDLTAAFPGRIGIDDGPDTATAPLLSVTYF